VTSGRPRAQVVVFGGGIAALEAVLALRDLCPERAEVLVVAPGHDFVLRPLAVLEPFGLGAVQRLPLAGLVRAAGARLLHDTLDGVDVERRRARAASGLELPYDALVVATGARAEPGLPGSVAFDGLEGVESMRTLLAALAAGLLRSLAFVPPERGGWTLPLYELALLTASFAAERAPDVRLTVVTAEPEPLAGFGGRASRDVAELLARHRIALLASSVAESAGRAGVRLVDGTLVPAERTVSMPGLAGPRVSGLPHDDAGFLPVDAHGRVRGAGSVYAAGDVTAQPVKQGGLAAQQADAVAEAIAAALGEPLRPSPFKPVLRGVLLTGEEPHYLRSDEGMAHARRSLARLEPLWWPPTKVAGERLGPLLVAHGAGLPPAPAAAEGHA
jgi:sulfide:quinone oxidoreductase